MPETKQWKQDDPLIRPVPLAKYPWRPLPSPPLSSPGLKQEAVIKVSLIPTSTLTAPLKVFTTFVNEVGDDGGTEDCPCWSFLLEKERENGEREAILWDMGLREDPENAPKKIVDGPLKSFIAHPGPGPIAKLQEHGYELARLKLVVFSHQHFDHACDDLAFFTDLHHTRSGNLDTLPQPAPPILLGPGSLESIGKGYPEDPNAAWPSSWLQNYHFVELPEPDYALPAEQEKEWSGEIASLDRGCHDDDSKRRRERKWEPVGCFDKGVDWFGDGSLWFLDTPGHCPGHLMALCRVTTNPDTYILLGGDASHHQTLYLPVPQSSEADYRSPLPVLDGEVQLATDPERATYTIGQLTRMSREENVMVVLAHEGEVDGVVDQYPGDLGAWKEKGWKEGKERGVEEAARKRLSARQ